jgi:hypothetical protein
MVQVINVQTNWCHHPTPVPVSTANPASTYSQIGDQTFLRTTHSHRHLQVVWLNAPWPISHNRMYRRLTMRIKCWELLILLILGTIVAHCHTQMWFAPGFSNPDKYRWDSRLFDEGWCLSSNAWCANLLPKYESVVGICGEWLNVKSIDRAWEWWCSGVTIQIYW